MGIAGDNPISDPAQDLFGRTKFAQHIADEIRIIDASQGSVFSVMGPWGSGKTSLINLVRGVIQRDSEISVLDFNSWMFSGTEQLIESFFAEISAQLKLRPGRLSQIAEELDSYGQLISPLRALPFVGSWVARVGEAAESINEFQKSRSGSVEDKKRKLARKLEELDFPVVIVIDDIDRLESEEIRQIFKLVRLTASFPNVIYLLAFDRARVEQALSSFGVDGRAYLEKIVQAAIDIPVIPNHLLLSQLLRHLDSALDEAGCYIRFDADRWPDVLAEIVQPLVSSMRDVRRYAASVRGVARTLNGDIEIVDVLALEAVRVFVPGLAKSIFDNREAITTVRSFYETREPSPEHAHAVKSMLEISEGRSSVAESLIRRIFPAAERHLEYGTHHGLDSQKEWLRKRRVAHPDVLSLYFERAMNQGFLAFSDAEVAFGILHDSQQLRTFLESLESERREEVISALEIFEGHYPDSVVIPGSIAILNVFPSIPERERGFLSLGGRRLVVTRVVLRLYKSLADDQTRAEECTRTVLDGVETLSAKLELVNMVGHREHVGYKLVSEEAAASFEDALSVEIQERLPNSFEQEPELFGLVLWIRQRREAGDQEFLSSLFDDAEFNRRILLESVTAVHSQTMGSRRVRKRMQLHWEALEIIYGDESVIRAAVASVRPYANDGSEDLSEAIALADRYLGGWRPAAFGRDEE